ncbi:ATP-binding protein [Deferrisoma camini]|uniref:ATP-binding protein n=1 Tax=Deferrisoma camini TaxID=1035120 RepID=UPI00046CD21E|nr:ATP-binding protein [Deferrisoma camini]
MILGGDRRPPVRRVLVRWFLGMAALAALALGLAVYFPLVGALRAEFEEREQAELARTQAVLRARLSSVRDQVRRLAEDNGVRVGLLIGPEARLREVLRREAPPSGGAVFGVRTAEGRVLAGQDLPWAPEQALAGTASPPRWVFQQPIRRGDRVLGEAWGVYDLTRDTTLCNEVGGRDGPGLGVRKGGRVVWVCGRPGDPRPVPGMPAVVRATDPGALTQNRRRLALVVAAGLAVALGLAWVAASVVSERVAGPLAALASEAAAVAEDPTLGTVAEDAPYAELVGVRRALRAMVAAVDQNREQARFREVFELAVDPMVLADRAGRIVALNRETRRLLGEIPAGRDLRSYLPPSAVATLLERAKQGDPSPLTVRVHGDPPRHLDVRSRITRFGGREVVLLQGRDVSDRVRAEQEVRRREAFLGWVLDHLDEAVLILDSDRRVRYYNRPFVELWGLPPSFLERRPTVGDLIREVARKGLYDPLTADALVRRRIEDLSRPGPVVPIHTPRRDGREVEAFAARLPDGGFLLTYRDITERVCGERERAMLSAAVEQSHDGLALATPVGNLIYLNPAYERLCGVPRAEALGAPYWDVPAGAGPDPAEVDAALAGGKVWQGRVEVERADGTAAVHDVTVGEVEVRPGERCRVVVRRDVTEQVEMETQLAQAQKMEALGVLAGGVAHDFNNLLMAFLGNLEILRARTRGDERLDRVVARMERAVMRARDLVRRILTFSGRQPRHEGPVDVGMVVREVVGLARSGAPPGVVLREAGAPSHAMVEGDASELNQALMNLVVNAVQAVGQAGTVEVGVECADGWVKIWVQDDGPGIPPDLRARIFDPFFTTKAPGEGTGLGLAMVRAIVERHGGEVIVTSSAGSGTRFCITLPRRAGRAESEPGGTPETDAPALRVLVVDDDPEVGKALVETLRLRGHQVEVAESGEEALKRLRQGAFDVVVTDDLMPGMSGAALAQRVKRDHPSVAVILISGTVDDGDRRGSADARLTKPVTVAELERTVHRVIGRTPS